MSRTSGEHTTTCRASGADPVSPLLLKAAWLYQSYLVWGVLMRQGVFVPPGRSCLFANTSNRHSFISRSLKIRCSSCLASSIRSLS